MPKPLRIGLLWHSPSSGNLGVGALTLANLALAREVAQAEGYSPEFTIFGMREPNRSYLNDDRVKIYQIGAREMFSPGGYWSEIGNMDCVLDIGAGDSFADIYGAKRFVYLWLTKALTIGKRKPLLLSPQTIGPFTKRLYRVAARRVLNDAAAVVARDEMSLAALKELAPKAAGILSVDVAFALPFEDRSIERGGRTLRVGVNISGLLYNEARSGRNRFGLEIDYADLMRSWLVSLGRREDVEVHLVTHALHSEGDWDDDGRVADLLVSEFPWLIRVPDFTGPMEAKSYISHLDFLVAGRMHACIAALSSGVPVVPIAYSRKFSGLFGMLGYDWMIPVKGMATAQAEQFLDECVSRRAELAREASHALAKAQLMLDSYRDALAKFFRSAGDRRA